MSELEHRGEMVDDFLVKDLHAECSCGWEGATVKTLLEAIADHAKHIHMARNGATSESDPQ